MKRHQVNNVREISIRLRQARQAMQLRQSDCAELMNVSLSHYNKLEQGIGGVSDGVLLRAARVLDVDFNWLKTGEGMKDSDFCSPAAGVIEDAPSPQVICKVLRCLREPSLSELVSHTMEATGFSREEAIQVIISSLP